MITLSSDITDVELTRAGWPALRSTPAPPGPPRAYARGSSSSRLQRQLRAQELQRPRPHDQPPPPRTVRARPAPLVPRPPRTARSPSPVGAGWLSLPSRARPAADLTAPRQPQRPLTLLACRGAGAVPRGARRHPARGATRRVDARFVRSGAWAGAPCSCARQAVGGPPLLLRAHLSRYSLPHPPPPSPGQASEQFFLQCRAV